jgi:LDH2 family malate/lactate/ureidoglycolate dehydrogenase
MKISAQELTKLVAAVLQHAGAHEVMAQTTANALVLAESQGCLLYTSPSPRD